MTLDQLAAMVESELSNRTRQLGSYRLTVAKASSFRDEENLWHIFVEVDQPIPQRGQYYDILNDVEELFQTKHQESVMLVPVKPRSASQAS